MKKIFLILFCTIIAPMVFAQSEKFQKTFGGTNNEYGYAHKQLPDGSFVLVGKTYSFGAGGYDAYLVKIDNTGDYQWSKTYGDIYDENFYDVLLTADNGYLLAGTTSYNANSTNALYLVKTDADGVEQWSKTYYDATPYNEIHKIITASDGGYLCVGQDAYYISVLKIDASGNSIFSFHYDLAGTGISHGASVKATADGGYIITGQTRNNSYLNDLFLLKINATGTTQWTKSFTGGSGGSVYGNDIVLLNDGSFVIAGYTDAYGAGNTDALLMKMDANGNLQWSHTYGGSDFDVAESLVTACDGGFILSGNARSFKNGIEDLFLIKTDALGRLSWSKIYGGLQYEDGTCVSTDAACGIVVSGTTQSYGAGGTDLFFLKLDTDGNDSLQCNIQIVSATQINPSLPSSNVTNAPVSWINQNPVTVKVAEPPTLQNDSICKSCVPPQADFDFVQNILSVNFLNYSENGILYAWDFGDGTTDTMASPVHHYTNTGNYTVRLVTTNECGSDTIIKKAPIISTNFCIYNTQPGPLRNEDTFVWSLPANANSSGYLNPDVNAIAWTWGGATGITRSFLKFDLSEVCDLHSLLGASLSLFNPTGLGNGGYQQSGNNAFSLYRITDPWELKIVSWNHQPAYTTQNAVSIPSSSIYSSVIGADVTAAIKDMITYGNNGFLIKLNTEQIYAGITYGSGDWPIASERPLLQLTFNPLYASVSFSDTTLCIGDSVQLQASGGMKYKWYPAKGLSCVDCANPKANPGSTIEYSVYVYNCENCAEVKKVAIHYQNSILINNHVENICQGDSVMLAAYNLDSYQWFPSDGLNNDTLAALMASPIQSTMYHVTGSSNGCISSDSVLVNVNNFPSLKDTSLCRNTSIALDLSGSGGTYRWQNGSIGALYTVADTGWYWVETTNLCGTKRDSFRVKSCCADLRGSSLFDTKEIKHCFEENGAVSLNAIWGDFFLWKGSSSATSSLLVSEPGHYLLTASDRSGCSVTDSVELSDYCPPRIFVPEAFSPNGDGNNDQLEIFGNYLKNFEIKIFNRWGEIIYISNDRNIGWDGSYRGKEMPIGIYPWTIHYEGLYDSDSTLKTKEGAVTLLR